MDLRTYLTQAVRLAEPHDLWGAVKARKITKWFFDFTRNVMILGVVKYIAEVTTSPILDAFYWAALGMMALYIYSFTNMVFQFRPFVFLSNNMLSRILDNAVNVALGAFLFFFAIGAIHVAITEIARGQG